MQQSKKKKEIECLLYSFCSNEHLLSFFVCFCFWLHYEACWILVLLLRIKPLPPALRTWSLNHWPTREVLLLKYFRVFWVQSTGPLGKYKEILIPLCISHLLSDHPSARCCNTEINSDLKAPKSIKHNLCSQEAYHLAESLHWSAVSQWSDRTPTQADLSKSK